MPRDSKSRPSHTYPQEYMKLFLHVLQTGKEVVIDSLGAESGPYTSLRHSMNSWRSALKREGSPLAPDLYGVVGNIEKVSIKGQMQFVLILRKRDAQYSEALAQIPGIVDMTSPPDMTEVIQTQEKIQTPLPVVPPAPESTILKTMDEIFGKKD